MKKDDCGLNVLSWKCADKLFAPRLGSILKTFLSPRKIDSQEQTKLASLPNWEALTDAQILAALTESHVLKGKYLIVTDLSFTQFDGIFCCLISQIDEFISLYRLISNECLFNGDVFFISIDDNTIYYFHHEGHWFLIDLMVLP